MDSTDNRNNSGVTGNYETVTVEQAAKELGLDVKTLRSWMRHKQIDIGIADRKEGREKWSYTVYRTWLENFKRSINVPS